ncbi:hypothetical protein AB0I84_26545 [Streptomyces spectabilis]|uniref:hypothetical protein n=1 Tax=Streptomyces spectabilis TaxID=68270 RepID=UPI0033CCFDF4
MPDPAVPWAAAQEARLKSRLPGYHAHSVTGDAARIVDRVVPGLTPVHRCLHWTRRVPLGVHLAHLGSRSYFASLGPDRSAAVLADERTHLLEHFPDGTVEEAYALDLTVVRSPRRPHRDEAARGSPCSPRKARVPFGVLTGRALQEHYSSHDEY